MNKLVSLLRPMALVVAAASAASCAPDTRSIDDKLTQIAARLDRIERNIGRGGGAGAAAQQQRPPEPDREKTYSMPIDGDPQQGPSDAKITIVKGYEYACFYCEKVRGTLEEIVKKYGADVRIISKQFVVHPQSATAPALAACAAHKQGRFEQMDKLLWEKVFAAKNFDKDKQGDQGAQRCWDTPEGCPIVVGLAQELQLNMEQFKADMKGQCQQFIQRDQAAMRQLGMSATPGFFINGRWISGAQQLGTFTAVIDDELKKANERIAAGTPKASYYQTWVVEKGLKTLDGKPAPQAEKQ
jgi:protein-disulfide isomerase